MSTPNNSPHWSAPERAQPLRHSLSLPGSKSLTNRELVLAALAEGPSTLRRPLHSRDTTLMVEALRSLGATITEVPGDSAFGPDLAVAPIPEGSEVSASVDCGLAGTVMRFVPPLAALVRGTIRFDGDIGARRRPMATTLHALTQLGLEVDDEGRDTLPFTITSTGQSTNNAVSIDASGSSQFVSGLLLMGARLPGGLTVTHTGSHLPSLPHIEMTVSCLRARGVEVDASTPGVWKVSAGPIRAVTVDIEPDLSNAAPFLAAPLIVGGKVSIEGWPKNTTQVGADVPRILESFGATFTLSDSTLTLDGGTGWRHGATIPGVDLDLSHAGELAPTVISLAALASSPSVFRGIGHLRGHETDRLAALVENIRALGGNAEETTDGIALTPAPLDGGLWKAFTDHRMATSGALLGLGVRGVVVDDISSTGKTLPEFPDLWAALVKSSTP
jgi:3-phosphoshikimate 1-carboxyvinyltransferase